MSYCLSCGAGIDEYDSAYYARNMLCIPCYVRKSSEVPMVTCNKCGMRIRQEESRSRRGGAYCGYCFSELERIERLPTCGLCAKAIEYYQESARLSDGSQVHSECARKKDRHLLASCSVCGRETDHFKILPQGKVLCSRCDKSGAGSRARPTPILAALMGRIGSMLS